MFPTISQFISGESEFAVIDGAVPEDMQAHYADLSQVKWIYNRSTYNWSEGQVIDDKVYDVGYMVCPAVINKVVYPHFEAMRPLLDVVLQAVPIEFESIERIKLNLEWRCPEAAGRINRPHADVQDPKAITVVYYMNDADGDTVLFLKDGSEARVTPKMGRLVVFKSAMLHAGSNPQVAQDRALVNFVLNPVQ